MVRVSRTRVKEQVDVKAEEVSSRQIPSLSSQITVELRRDIPIQTLLGGTKQANTVRRREIETVFFQAAVPVSILSFGSQASGRVSFYLDRGSWGDRLWPGAACYGCTIYCTSKAGSISMPVNLLGRRLMGIM